MTIKMRNRLLLRLAMAALWTSLFTQLQAQEVIPDFYREPGISPNKNYVNQDSREFIDPQNGGLQHHYTDLHLPGEGGFDLKVVRSYNSTAVDPINPSSYSSIVGVGWTMHFGRVLKVRNASICTNLNAISVADNPVIEMNDGSRQLLTFPGSVVPLAITAQRWKAECIGGGTGLAVYSPDGTRYDMTQQLNVGTAVNPINAWYTTKITDRNGNFANINYSGVASDEITSISTSDGRFVNFTYIGSGTSGHRLASVSSAGQTYNYAYQLVAGTTDRYHLISVQRPGGTYWSYEYNGNVEPQAGSHVMRRWIYPQGGSVAYGYAYVYFDGQANPASRSTVVTSKTQSTGGVWTFSYTPGGPGVLDTTVVNSPSGIITYRHVGPNYVSSGTVWTVGLLISKQLGSQQTENYTWDKQAISSENYFRPGAFVLKVDAGATYAPILTRKDIVRNGASYSTVYSNHDGYGNPQLITENGPNGGSRNTSLSHFNNTSLWILGRLKDESFVGSSTIRSYDNKGNLLSINRDGVLTVHTYTSAGDIASTTFPRGLVHSYSSHFRGIAQVEQQPEAVTIRRTVSDAGNVTAETNGDLFSYGFGYDGLNRLISISYPRGNPVSITYTATTKTAVRGSLVETTVYNGLGRVSSITLGGIQRTYGTDALGRIVFESNPAALVGTSYEYDILNRRIRTTNADNTAEVISWGSASRSVRDENFFTTTYQYRAYGDPDRAFVMSVTAPEPSLSLTILRNARDLVTAIGQGGRARGYGYDANYYLASETNPETGTTLYSRDAAGNMTSRSVGGTSATTYVYDGQNRVVSTLAPGAPSAVTHAYNKRGRIVSASGWGGLRTYAYDANGNLTSEALTIDGGTGQFLYAYNANDQLQSMTYPLYGRVVNYAPDVLGRPTQVSGFVSAITYWPSGQIESIAYVNGVATNYGQNNRLWPSTFVTQKTGSPAYAFSTYGYDGVGNLMNIADSSDSTYSRTFGYDAVNRITTFNGFWGAGSYSYGANGNLATQVAGGASITYSYDTANRLASVVGVRAANFSYDTQGNTIAGNGTTYGYDGMTHMVCANCGNATSRVDYSYDGSGMRSSVTKAGIKTYELYDQNGKLLFEFTPALAGKLVEHIYLGGRRIAQVVTP